MAVPPDRSVSRAAWLGNARLASGLVLFTYVATHLLNHALGLLSLNAMEYGREWFLAAWRNPAGTVILYGALVGHVGLTLWSLYERRSLRMRVAEAFRIILGLAIPLLLIVHIVGTRIAHDVGGAADTYSRMIFIYFELYPVTGIEQVMLLLAAWIHGSMGVYWWVRPRPWFPRFAATFTGLVLLVPVLALLGFANAGREVSRLGQNPSWAAARKAEGPRQSERKFLRTVEDSMRDGFFISVGLVLAGRVTRYVYRSCKKREK